jgi:hypothetical protein
MIRVLGALIAVRATGAGAPALLGAGMSTTTATAAAAGGGTASTLLLPSARSTTTPAAPSSALLLLRRCLQTGTPAEAAAAAATTTKTGAAAAKKPAKKAAADGGAAKTKKKKKKVPAVPRPLSAYTLFTKDNAKDVMQRQGLSAPDAMRALAARWAGLGPSERAPFLRRAQESKAAADAMRAEIKARRAPPSAYSAFSAEVMRELRAAHPPAAPTDCVRMAAERWRRLSAGERQQLEDAARAARDAWRAAGGGGAGGGGAGR